MSAQAKLENMVIEKYRCQNCQKIHDDEYRARYCCPPESMYYCSFCNKEYHSYCSAVDCCNTYEKRIANKAKTNGVNQVVDSLFDQFVTLKALADNEIESFRAYINEYFPYVVKEGNMLSLAIAFNRFSGKVAR